VILGPDDPADLSDADLLGLYELDYVLSLEAMMPGDPIRNREQFLAAHRTERVDSHRRLWRQLEGERVVGLAWVFWRLADENRHLARVTVGVAPDSRRQRRASELLRLAAEHAQADGRTLIQTWTGDRQASGEAFCRAVGAEVGLVTHENRLRLADVDRAQLAAWVRAGEALPDYDLVFVEIPTPPELLSAAAEIAHVINTAPRDDLHEEDETFTPERLAAWERENLAGGHSGWRLYARHRPSGNLVGLTQIGWLADQGAVVDQGDTGVLPEHRGKGLAKWLKAAMLEKVLAELPAAQTVVTGNAYSNDAMLAINNALGFRPAGRWTVWQVGTEAVLRYTSRQSARPLE
jgi:mycothiol synthase